MLNDDVINFPTETKYKDYLDSYDIQLNKNYHIWFYFPYIDINKGDNELTVLRIAFNTQLTGRNTIKLIDRKLLEKILPIYKETYDTKTSIIDVYHEEFIKMINNRKRQLKLKQINAT